MSDLIPSPKIPTALAALRELASEAVAISIAAAFVTNTGVEELETLLGGREVALEVCGRGAPITEQSALLRLRDELGAVVTVVMGPDAVRFHPKLWLIRSETGLAAMSGSGNLTRGGLIENVEQFDLSHYELGSHPAEAEERRFGELVKLGVPLAEAITSPSWYEWTAQKRDRDRIARELQRLDGKLASQKVTSREKDKRALCRDLYELYERTVAARLPRADGGPYIPHYLKRGLDNWCGANNPVPLVTRLCRDQTKGFDVILEHGTRDLTVEALAVDSTKPYHDLFDEETLARAYERLLQFDG